MRPSTLFGLAGALFLFLIVFVGAKYSGLFDSPAAAKETPIQVLVAKSNLFEGTTTTSNDVMVRALNQDELDYYQRNKDKFMPATVAAAHMRILARSVPANEPLLKEYFLDQTIPDTVSQRLAPGMRAVNVVVPKERAGGGMLRLGERVDVLLTSNIAAGDSASSSGTAPIARNLKVIVKRDNLWTVMAPIPVDRPVTFTLEANPYRAALIEFAKHRGMLTLVPSATAGAPRTTSKSFSDPDSKEYRDEDERVRGINSGEVTVGDADLERIFNLKPLARRVPPLRIDRFTGVTYIGTTVFYDDGGVSHGHKNTAKGGVLPPEPTMLPLDGRALGYRFERPTDPTPESYRKEEKSRR